MDEQTLKYCLKAGYVYMHVHASVYVLGVCTHPCMCVNMSVYPMHVLVICKCICLYVNGSHIYARHGRTLVGTLSKSFSQVMEL